MDGSRRSQGERIDGSRGMARGDDRPTGRRQGSARDTVNRWQADPMAEPAEQCVKRQQYANMSSEIILKPRAEAEGDAARPQLGGVLVTVVPSDKKTSTA